jgi:hypothetical protein
MNASTFRTGTIDRIGIALSGLCVVHCVASAVFVAVLASAGGILVDHRIHEIGLLLAIGALSIPHGGNETLYTILGVAILALGHDLNRRAVI